MVYIKSHFYNLLQNHFFGINIVIKLKDPANSKMTLYRNLYDSLRKSIISGEYQAGEKLPSSRELSKTLGVSRNIVVNCYEQLNAEGYIETRFGSGSFVAANAIQQPLAESKQIKQEPVLTNVAKKSMEHWRNYDLNKDLGSKVNINFQYGPVNISDELLADINRIARKCRETINSNYQHPEGLQRLREIISRYAQQNRGCRCRPENIVITNGSQQALDLIARMLLKENDEVLIEEPAYRGATQAFTNLGAKLIRSEVDENGINPDLFTEQKAENARLIYTTPSHQFPTGGVLSLPRRLALLEWANTHNAFIIEDDYDSEFRYQGPPIESIQGLDECDQTIYMGTFSKVLSPVMRVGYVILPDSLVEAFTALKWCADRHSPLLNQLILAEFMDSPLFAKHLKRSRKTYSKRHDVLINALNKHFGDDVTVQGTNAGIHILAWMNKLHVSQEAELLSLADSMSLGLYTPTSLFEKTPERLGLLMGYGNLSCEKIEKGIEKLAECYALLEKRQ
ncbi:MAG: GntR family transcriptional regulator/MocR family aminotransferase [Cocleimonas sp.]